MRPTGLLHEVVAGHDPDQVAIRHQGAELTYRELEQRSHQLAHALRRHGIGPGHIVALLLDRGPHLVVAELAVLTAGAAWLPLDPQLPPARLAFMTADAAVPLVLTTTDLAHLAPDTPAWCLDQHTLDGPDTPPDVDVRPDDPAYLIYTSGSTGQPKGVLVSHRSAHGYTTTAVRRFGLTPADRVAQVASPAFDAHVFDVYAALLAGATLISAARDTVLDPVTFTRIIRIERVTVSFVPPAILALLDPDRAGRHRPPRHLLRWRDPARRPGQPLDPTRPRPAQPLRTHGNHRRGHRLRLPGRTGDHPTTHRPAPAAPPRATCLTAGSAPPRSASPASCTSPCRPAGTSTSPR